MQFSLPKSILAVVFSSLFMSSLFANSAEISLNSNTFKLQGDFELGNNGIVIEASGLHNQDRGNVLGVAGLLFGDAGSEGLNAGIGLKLAYLDPDFTQEIECPDTSVCTTEFITRNLDGGAALPIGGKVTYVPAAYNRVNARAYVWYAPDVLSFDKMTKYQEIGADVGFNVTRNADVFVGYRNVKGKFKGNDVFSSATSTIDTGLHFGIRGRF